jgi:hypothetical protein
VNWQTVVEALVHLALHWEVLYGNGGRGWLHERRATRELNRYSIDGPSSDERLAALARELDPSVSPPPAHSAKEPCF